MAKDMIGNTLAEGDFIRLTPPDPILGRVIKITHGGAIIGHHKTTSGKTAEVISPGIITVEIIAQATFDPSTEICSKILKVVDPDPPKKPLLKAN